MVTECAIRSDGESDAEEGDSVSESNTLVNSGDVMDLGGEIVIECLCYKHVTLVLLPNPDGERDILAMEVDLRFTKEHKRTYKRKIFYLYEVDDLIFDPVICMIALGILDNAFELEFQRAEDIFKLRVNKHRGSMPLEMESRLGE